MNTYPSVCKKNHYKLIDRPINSLFNGNYCAHQQLVSTTIVSNFQHLSWNAALIDSLSKFLLYYNILKLFTYASHIC